jgi:pimeloyl-ACP methyl ester carboxylesterase
MAGRGATRGTLSGGLPFNRIGAGPPVLVLQGLTFANRPLSGFETRFAMAPYRSLAEERSVYVVNRRPRMKPGTTLDQMAAQYAAMLRVEFEPPVDVIGNSSGGSIALHLAAEHPSLVRRLVLQDCGCRTTDEAQAWGRDVIRLAEAGRWRAVSQQMIRTVQPDNLLGRTAARLFAPLMAMNAPADPIDMVALLEAQDEHDFGPRLGEIGAPTLVACGELDPFSGADLARETAAGIPRGRAAVYAGQRHGVRGEAFERDLLDFLVGEVADGV